MVDDTTREIRKQYLSSGRFAMAAQLSRKALRLYDEQALLVPEFVDPESGYRYYSPDQLETASTIRHLREMQMPLAEIKRVLAAPTEAAAIEIVIAYRRSIEQSVDQMRRATYRAIANIRKELDPMSIEISTKEFPACHAYSISKNIRVPAFHQFIPEALGMLRTHIEETNASIAGDPICFYYGPVNENDDGPIEICWPANGELKPSGDIIVREIPAHHGAFAEASVEESQFPKILDVWNEVVGWVQQSEHTMNEETVCCYEIWPKEKQVIVVQPFATR